MRMLGLAMTAVLVVLSMACPVFAQDVVHQQPAASFYGPAIGAGLVLVWRSSALAWDSARLVPPPSKAWPGSPKPPVKYKPPCLSSPPCSKAPRC